MRQIFVLPIKGYQRVVSPALPRSCKYHPSCSQYAVDAVSSFGVVRGSILAMWRLLRCNPFSDGGYDPVERQTLFYNHLDGACPGTVEDLEAIVR
ncbi:MAG: membrane protein insertion efficiency factor YidD [Thermoleophilia bacterium]